MVISDKLEFNVKTVTWDKEHYMLIIGSMYQEDITIIKIYALNIRASTYMKQMPILKGEIDSSKNNSNRFQHPTFNNTYGNETEYL